MCESRPHLEFVPHLCYATNTICPIHRLAEPSGPSKDQVWTGPSLIWERTIAANKLVKAEKLSACSSEHRMMHPGLKTLLAHDTLGGEEAVVVSPKCITNPHSPVPFSCPSYQHPPTKAKSKQFPKSAVQIQGSILSCFLLYRVFFLTGSALSVKDGKSLPKKWK